MLRGTETLTVTVAGAGGGTASFALPPLPAPDAHEMTDQLQARMHDLTRYRVDEVLRPAAVPLAVTYAYQAPDRVWFQVAHGSETVIVGETRYSRDGPGSPWRVDPVPAVQVPDFIWDAGPVVAPRALGTLVEDGRKLHGVTFFEGAAGTPIWFELWADDQGLVWRAEMRAQAHFMEHRYSDFDGAFDVHAPVSSAAPAGMGG